ncbi:SurA N-terminal domain-containing protein [Alphaproteobacteria bacterium]|nr:SurA N-terminal domain-containing protein [Alphaproteobacteria bacterium]
MLKFLRDHANSWIMKILLGILVLSFGLFWGVSEFFRGTDTSNTVASIGKFNISKQSLIHSVQKELDRLNKELKGKNITFSQALKFGLVSQNLGRMVNEIVLDILMRDTHLSVSDQAIANLIYGDPLFRNEKGDFDRGKFQAILRSNGLSEKGFFSTRRRSLSQMHLLTAVTVGGHVPAALAYPVFQSLTQKRSFRVATIAPQNISVSYTEKDLENFYTENPGLFKVLEQRDFHLILLDPLKRASKISLSEKEVRQAYEDQRENYLVPEMRSFSMISCENKEEAIRIKSQLKKGIFKDKKRQETHEKMTEDSLSKEIARVVFSLKKGQVSSPTPWQQKIILVRVDKIFPEKAKSLNEVRSQVSEDLKRQRAMDEISKITTQIEEGSNQGLSLSEIAKTYRLTLHAGRLDASGRPVKKSSLSLSSDIVKDIFSLPEKGETQLTELPDGISYLVSVNKIHSERLESFKESRVKAIKIFLQKKKQEKMMVLAEKVRKGMEKGQTTQQAAVIFSNTRLFSISEEKKKASTLPLSLVYQGFSLARKQAKVYQSENKVYVIMPLKIESLAVEKNMALYKAYKTDLGKSISQSVYSSFLGDLKKEYKAQLFPSVIASLKE